jgi:hypothetical protein
LSTPLAENEIGVAVNQRFSKALAIC